MFLNNRFTARLFSIIQQLEFDVNNSLYFVLVQSTIYPLAISDVEVGNFLCDSDGVCAYCLLSVRGKLL